MPEELSVFEIDQIKNFAKEKIGECRKSNDIIGTQVFSILGLYARVIYYPLGSQAPWGFTRISGQMNGSPTKKPFAAINTSISIPEQVFAAAHELYHIWYETAPDILPSDLLDEKGKGKNEKKANRFAAEFLIDEMLLHQEIAIFQIEKISLKSILLLADIFQVPYRAMVKRLYEISKINKNERDDFLSKTASVISQYQKRYGFSVGTPDFRIIPDNLVDLAVKAYESSLITFEKLEYLLSQSNLTTEDLGIYKNDEKPFPSDEELDKIMEEDE